MSVDKDANDVDFPEVNGPDDPGAVEAEVETYRPLVVAKDLLEELRFDGIPLRDEKTGEVFVVSVQEVGGYIDQLVGLAVA